MRHPVLSHGTVATMSLLTSPPPVPADAVEQARVAHTRLRRRMSVGQHSQDVEEYISAAIGQVRKEAWGKPDLSSCPLVASAEARATLFDPADDGRSAPWLSNSVDPTAVPMMDLLLEDSGIWPSMPRIQRDTIVMREELIRLDSVVDGDRVQIRPRPVTADMVEAVPDPRDPSRMIALDEWQCVGGAWIRDRWSIAGEPVHQVLDEKGRDLSPEFGLPEGGERGESYPVVGMDGRASLPYVLLHAALGTGALWDPYAEIGLVDGTLQVCLQWTFQGHILRNAAWAQRYTIGAEFGGITTSGNGSSQVVADPAVVLSLRAMEGFDGSPSAGQWSTTVDPARSAEAIASYERRLYSMAGMDPADVQRISGDPRSGYALEISTKSKEAQALRFAPVFRRPMVELVVLAAILANRATGGRSGLPEMGWDVEFARIRQIRMRAAMIPGAAAPPVTQ